MHGRADVAAEAAGLRDIGRPDFGRRRPRRHVPAICGSVVCLQSQLLGLGARDVADRRHRALVRSGARRDPAGLDAAAAGGDDFLGSQCARARNHAGAVRGGSPEGNHRPFAPPNSLARERSPMMSSIASEGPLLRIDALTKSFGGFVALDNISVEIRKGERFGLIGPNGSGKTTLVNCISGALRPNKGAVLFRDEDITPLPPNQRAHRGIARSFQIPRPFRSMTVFENLMVALDFAPGHLLELASHRRDAAMSILTRMGLASKAYEATA